MRAACIDIGSNTTRLLVADLDGGALREVLSERVFTRLGGHDGAIAAEKLAYAAATVAEQVRRAREAGAGEVIVVATAAIRAARNRDELCAALRGAAGVEMAVLTGEQEARLAFLGATATLEGVPAGTLGVVDVGGGSTEIVVGTRARGVDWSTSLALGSAALTQRFVRADPPAPAELEALRAHVDELLGELAVPPVGAAYAVGGSATSLARLVGPTLDRAALDRAVAKLCAGPAAEVAARLDLHPDRARVLPAGMLVLGAAGALLGRPLLVAAGGVREGAILDRFATSARP